MKIAATASYKAVPSILMVAPIGKTNLVIRGSTLFPSSKQLIATGRVAELEDVPNAVTNAWAKLDMYTYGFLFVIRKYNRGRTIKPCINRPINTVRKYIPSWETISSNDCISVILAATRNSTPTGDNLKSEISLPISLPMNKEL